MGVFRTKFVTENVEKRRETWRNVEERERERLKTLPYTINFQNFSQNLKNVLKRWHFGINPMVKKVRGISYKMFDQRSTDRSKSKRDNSISLHRVNHKTFATLQNASVDPKKLQSPKFICTIHWWHFGICNLHQCSWHRYILTTKSKCTLQTHPDISPRSLFFRYRTRGT